MLNSLRVVFSPSYLSYLCLLSSNLFLGEISAAVKYVRAAIDKDPGPSANSQFLHLLSLLTSSAGDDAKVRDTVGEIVRETVRYTVRETVRDIVMNGNDVIIILRNIIYLFTILLC